MKKLHYLFLWLGLVGCDVNEKDESSVNKINHHNGLAAEADFEYTSIEKIDNGFVFHRNPEDSSRQTDSITLELLKAYDISNTETRTIGAVTYQFHLDTFHGGSGGAEYTLRIWKPLDGSGVALEHYVQSEHDPDFAESWKLIESASVQFEKD
ncbi:Tsi3 family protein [Marinobacter lacisalsi]|uniref:Tsi3 family protein n=1 Tax=Marinobacter lacisalsi TaxID=475979 RepID=A0ABV8QG80_9GAMM